MCVCVCVCMCMCWLLSHVRLFASGVPFPSPNISLSVCVCIYIYIYIYIHTYIHTYIYSYILHLKKQNANIVSDSLESWTLTLLAINISSHIQRSAFSLFFLIIENWNIYICMNQKLIKMNYKWHSDNKARTSPLSISI